ncbi:sugar phosphate isomerase/epimerase family protein [Paenibacillus whitsoniae]|uniref:Sugar phosphate isomerase/epimerase n=1 Tax=Paenibacillus whitsoniae TaxID=2496558 RepID=A0A3S0IAU8_9BACL|nr:TIM barrel protein [Paenibacillus whitsoniae]RTE08919.1 sugar phosphate isomerase/epimerase [Paenibacillus whitsoniae]
MSWWTMNGLDKDDGSRRMEDRFNRIAEAGFDGINGFVPAPEEADNWRKLLNKYGLSFSVNAYPNSAADMAQFLAKAKLFGQIDFINAQVLTPFLYGQSAERLISEINALSKEAGIPVYIETHRGTITQDLIRTVRYAEHIEDLRLTIDFSHYVVAGEMHTVSEEAETHLQKLLTRTSSIHARVSNGEQIQVDVGECGEHPMMRHFERWWRSGMTNWLNHNNLDRPFPFICELGPPPYAITIDEYGDRRREIGDRWSQSLVFAHIARSIWKDIHK